MELPTIRKISECFIKPKSAAEESCHFLGPSELVLMSMCYLQKGLVFDKLPSSEEYHTFESFLLKLKESLSSTLAHFYPLAGQLVTQVDEEQHSSFIFIDNNKGPGAKFIHAVLDVDTSVDDIFTGAETPALIQLFFELGQISTNYDAHDEPMLVVQVTQLVDGIFLGISANHAVVDGTSFYNFLSSWSEVFRSNDITKISRPPIVHKRWFPEGCGQIVKIPHTHPDEFVTRYKTDVDENPLRKMIFHFSAESMASLKARANADCNMINKISSFQALVAIVWRSIMCARRLRPDEDATCIIVVNGRPRVNPPLPPYYFGNLLAGAFGTTKVGELLGSSLGSTSLLLQEEIGKVNAEYLRNMFSEWVKSPHFTSPTSTNPGLILVSGFFREDMYGIEFGLGKPVGIRTGSDQYDGKVVAQPGKQGRGSVSLEICLSPPTMTALLQDTELLSFSSSTSGHC